ncbi:MAG: SGNH/GDSL hydrolase family protein [Bacteroidota bacterium]
MNTKYLAGALISIPLLPLMYYQGKRIRSKVPQLPEAKGIEGEYLQNGSSSNLLNVISIGESTIAGVGVETHEEGFTGTFAKEISRLFHIGVKWKVYARSGYTARRVEQKIIPKIKEKQVDLIVVGLGGNDAFTLNRPSKWKNEVRGLIASLQAKFPEAIIVFCNMPPIKEFPAFTPLIKFTIGNLVEILGEELQKVVSEFKDVYYFGDKVTLEGWMEKFQLNVKKEDFFSDGVHPSKLTYQTWAKDIASRTYGTEAIKNALEQRV